MQHNKLKRGTSLFLVFALLFSCSLLVVSAEDITRYINLPASDGRYSGPAVSRTVHLQRPSWFQDSWPLRNTSYFVIGQFINCYPGAQSSTPIVEPIASGGTDNVLSLYKFDLYSLGEFSVNPIDSTKDMFFNIYRVYSSIFTLDQSLSSLLLSFSDDISTDPFHSVNLPFHSHFTTSGSLSLKITSAILSLSDFISFNFSNLPSNLTFSASSGGNLIPFTFDPSTGFLTISGYDSGYDVILTISGSDLDFGIDSVNVRYGLLLDESDILSEINGSLSSNFSSIIEILDSNNSWLGRIHTAISNGFTSVGSWFTSLWTNIASKFTDLQGWIQAQTDTLAGKLDILINGSAAQQEAVQQQQQINQNLQTNINNANNSLQQAGSSLSAVSKPSDVNMSLDGLGVDYSSLIMLTSPITGDSLIGAIMGLLAVLMLLSYVIFGRKG